MTRQRTVVDSLAQLAASAEPPPLDDTSARRMVDAALASSAPPVARSSSRLAFAGFAFAAVALAALVSVLVRGRAPEAVPLVSAPPALSRVTLPTGDHLAGSAGAQFEILELSSASRRLKLTTGEMVFDVAHAAPVQRFEVSTADTTVIATGTVFSVSIDAGVTRVRVFEGSVAVEHAGQRAAVVAGAAWSSAGTIAPRASKEITAAGESYARERASAPSLTPTATPTVTPTVTPIGANDVAAIPSPAPREVQPRPKAPRDDVAPGTAPPPSQRPVSLIDARAAIAAGRYDDALAAADAPARAGESGPWDLVRGDALRALGKHGDAATAYERAARALAAGPRAEAAYAAAFLRLRELADPRGALADLDDVAEGSTLEERALVLRVRALLDLQRAAEARVIAARYLDRFPQGGEAAKMKAIARPPPP